MSLEFTKNSYRSHKKLAESTGSEKSVQREKGKAPVPKREKGKGPRTDFSRNLDLTSIH